MILDSKDRQSLERGKEITRLCLLALRFCQDKTKDAVELLKPTGISKPMLEKKSLGRREEVREAGPLSEEEEKHMRELIEKYSGGKAKVGPGKMRGILPQLPRPILPYYRNGR